MQRRYGWQRDLPSQVPWFDHPRLIRRLGGTPNVTNNRPLIFWVYDQLEEGSCTANSGMGTNRYFRAVNKMPDYDGSRQFLYRVTGELEGNYLGQDNGASIADTVTAESQNGICLESTWPYSTPLAVSPSLEARAEAKQHLVLNKQPVIQTEDALEACLAAQQPIHYGMSVYESFESDAVAQSGVVPMPGLGEKMLGGHALWLMDYDRPNRLFFGQNSWGTAWGQGGLCLFSISYDYILDEHMASDFWTITGLQ